MMYFVARLALVLVTLPAAAQANTCREESRFLGFSSNEQGFAETIAVTCHPRAGITDRFTIARVFDTKSGHIKATFRASAPERLLSDGSAAPVSSETFAANYPSFRNAMRRTAWQQIVRAANFHHVRHAFEDEVVRFRAINNSIESVHVAHGVVTVRPQTHQALGFVVTARAKNDQELDITTVRGAQGETVRLEFFFSKSGYATVVHVSRAHGQSMWLTRKAALPAPIDSSDIGAINVMQWESQEARRDYGLVGDGQHTDAVEALIDDAFHI